MQLTRNLCPLFHMALALTILSQKGHPLTPRSPNPPPPPFTTSFLPPICPALLSSSVKNRPINLRRVAATTSPLVVVASSAPRSRIVRCPALDRHAVKYSQLRFVRKLKTLLLSKPRFFLPIRILARCRRYLGLPPSRPLLPMILRYPSLFHLFHAPSHTSPSLSLLSVALTPAAAALAADESLLRSRIAASLAAKLHRLLMLASPPHHRLLLSKLVHIAADLGLPADFRSRLCNSHPDRFRTVDTSYGRALELVSWDPGLAVPIPPIHPPDDLRRRPIIDRPPKFKLLRLRRGLNLKRRHRDYLIRFHETPPASPYSATAAIEGMEAAERRACAIVREVVGMAVEKRTLVDHLTHFRNEFGLPNRLRAMLVRHPEMFYVSIKGQRDSVFLVEAYDDKGRLVVEDELLSAKERLVELVREGKRMRRESIRGTAYDNEEVEGEDEDEEDDDDDDDDGLGDLLDSEIGDDWEDFDVGATGDDDDWVENGEFWSTKVSAERLDGGVELEAW